MMRAVSNAILNQAATNQMFAQNGAMVQRLNDVVRVGGATASDQSFPNVTQDWLSQFQVAAGLPSGTTLSTQLACLTSTSANSAAGILGASQSLQLTSAGASAIGVSAYVVNNHATNNNSAWAFYGEAHKTTAASGPTYAMELDTRTLVAASTPTPFSQGGVVAVQIASGAGLSAAGQFDASAAIQIESNPMKFKTGINFGATSITGTDGVTGSGNAIVMAKGHTLAWYESGGGQISTITSQVTAGANNVGIQFNDNGVQFTSPSGTLGYWFRAASAVNYPTLTPSATGSPVVFGASGTDTNVPIQLANQGTAITRLTGQTTQTTVGAAGAASAIPTPLGYLRLSINGTQVAIPYCNP